MGIQYLINIRAPEYAMDSVNALELHAHQRQPARRRQRPNAGQSRHHVQRTNGPPVVSHYNVMPVIDIFGGVSGRDLGGVLRDIQPLVKQAEKELPRGSFIIVRGQAETMHSSFIGLGIGLVMARLC